jgi:hypothetical protein
MIFPPKLKWGFVVQCLDFNTIGFSTNGRLLLQSAPYDYMGSNTSENIAPNEESADGRALPV